MKATSPLLVLQTDDGGFGHGGVGHDLVLELDRGDPFATGLHDVLRAVDDAQVGVLVDGGDIAGPEPAVSRERLRRTRVVVVLAGDPRTAHLQLTAGLAVPGHAFTGDLIHHSEVDTDRDHADGGAQVGPLVLGEAVELALELAARGQRAGLGHAPGLLDGDAVVYDSLGRIILSCSVKNGVYDGPFLKMKNGDTVETVSYSDGLRKGPWRSYFNGKIERTDSVNYTGNKPFAEMILSYHREPYYKETERIYNKSDAYTEIYYYPNGKKKSEVIVDGTARSSKVYDEKGNLK